MEFYLVPSLGTRLHRYSYQDENTLNFTKNGNTKTTQDFELVFLLHMKKLVNCLCTYIPCYSHPLEKKNVRMIKCVFPFFHSYPLHHREPNKCGERGWWEC